MRKLNTGSPAIEVVSLTVPPPMIRQPEYHTWARSRIASPWPMRTHEPLGVVHWYAHPATIAHAFSLYRPDDDPSRYLPRPEPEQRLFLLRQIDYLRHLITLGKLGIHLFPPGTEAAKDADGVTLYRRHQGRPVLAHDIGPSVREIADVSRPDVLGWLKQIRAAAGPPEEGAELPAEQYRAMCEAVCGPGWRCPHNPSCPDPAAPDAEAADRHQLACAVQVATSHGWSQPPEGAPVTYGATPVTVRSPAYSVSQPASTVLRGAGHGDVRPLVADGAAGGGAV
ncbi:hypothetical protein [Streptomyces sp. BBFR102]|uniref:hypothetical protein n=1 Tax=Streptomyces sp. BBFR102 TaxID=3448171 RepID=UPI003F53638C